MLETADASDVSPQAWRQLPPAFEWNDLVLPSSEDEQLRAIAAEFTERFREATGAAPLPPRGGKKAILVLFCGPGGTGKTMAAQTLAHELRLGVIEANLKSVLVRERWRMSRLFAIAARSGAVLVFDRLETMIRETADAAGGDIADRASDFSDLLERSARHPGIVIFATRLGRLGVEPVLGRFDHVIEFPLPGRAAREELWRRHLTETAVGESDISTLADAVEMTGGEIAACCAAAKQSCARAGVPTQIGAVVRGLERADARDALIDGTNEAFELLRARIKPGTGERTDADRSEVQAQADPAPVAAKAPDLGLPERRFVAPALGQAGASGAAATAPAAAGPAVARETHARRWVIAGLSGIVVAAALGLALAGTKGESALPALDHRATAGPVLVSYPSSWRTRTAPSLPGDPLSHAVALSPAGSEQPLLVVGTAGAAGATLLPPGLIASVSTPVAGQIVKLGSLSFYRFPELAVRGNSHPETVYVLPTTAGLVTSACLRSDDGFTGACERVLGAFKLSSGVRALATNPEYPSSLSEVIAELNRARVQAYSQLAAARTGSDQASIESRLAQANARAAAAIARLDAGPAAVANAALAAGLRSTADAYASMALAASRNDVTAYRVASSSLGAAAAATRAAVADLKTLGYAVG